MEEREFAEKNGDGEKSQDENLADDQAQSLDKAGQDTWWSAVQGETCRSLAGWQRICGDGNILAPAEVGVTN